MEPRDDTSANPPASALHQTVCRPVIKHKPKGNKGTWTTRQNIKVPRKEENDKPNVFVNGIGQLNCNEINSGIEDDLSDVSGHYLFINTNTFLQTPNTKRF